MPRTRINQGGTMRKAKLLVVAMFTLALLAVPAAADAKRRDRDHDGLPDKWEKRHDLSVHKKSAKKDPDRDGLNNKREFSRHSDPRDADTDNDGLDDGDDVRMGDDPCDDDTDNDGVEDGDELAGTVQSFDSSTGVLTIALAGGGTQSGTVTDATRIECEDEDAELSSARHDGEDESGDDRDNSGPGSTSSGPGRDGDGDRGDDDRGDDDGDDDEDCTTADLTEGRVVHEAKIVTNSSGDVVFRKIELDS
jgi:hypothetical protein